MAALAAACALRHPASQPPKHPASPPLRIAVAPLAITGPLDRHLGPALTDRIIAGLHREPRAVTRPIDSSTTVDYVVQGELSGDATRIRAELRLVAAADRTITWRGHRSFAVDELPQLEIWAAETALSAAGLAPTTARRHAPGGSAQPASYTTFLLGIAQHPNEPAEHATKIATLEAAIAQDDRFAPAHAALGYAYMAHASKVGGHSGSYGRAAAALERAFALDDESPETLQHLAALCAKTGQAERSAALLDRAQQLYPHEAQFQAGFGYACRYGGLMHESIAAYRRAQQCDPSTENLISCERQIAKSWIYLGDFDRALASHAQIVKLRRQSGGRPIAKRIFYEGIARDYAGQIAAAVDLLRRSAQMRHDVWSQFAAGYAARATGDQRQLTEILTELEQRQIVDGERHYRLVHLYLAAGDRAAALHHLRASIDGGFFNYPYMAHDPWIDGLRNHPEFVALLDRAERRHRAFARQIDERRN